MMSIINTLVEKFPIRRSKDQKDAFRAWVLEQAVQMGYQAQVEAIKDHNNVVIGNPETAKAIFTAHYDTPASFFLPNFMTPCNKVFFHCRQIGMILLMVAIGAAVGIPVGLLTGDERLGFIAGWLVYMAFVMSMIMGPANKHNVNDNTSGVVTLLEIAMSLTPEQREKTAFVFFDNEEKGLFGSSGFYRKHRKHMQAELLVNFDCVSDGDHMLFFPRRQAKKQGVQRLEQAYQSTRDKQVRVIKSFGFYPSDQKHFPVGVGVAALHRRPLLGYCLGRIHTRRDTVMDERNIELLRQGSLRLLDGAED